MSNFCKEYEIAANSSMKADEVAFSFLTHQSSIPLTCAKIDRVWQKRGHSSANGVVKVTVVNKCEDTMFSQSTVNSVRFEKFDKGHQKLWLTPSHTRNTILPQQS